MYCTRCNAYNDDTAHFCNNCGAELTAPQNNEQQYNNQEPPQNNNSPYSQPMYNARQLQYSNVLPIVAIVGSILNFNILGIIFAFMALSKYNNSERAMRIGDFMTADMLGSKSKTYSIISLVISIALLVVRPVLVFILAFFFTGVFEELAEYSYDYYMMLTNVFAMFM